MSCNYLRVLKEINKKSMPQVLLKGKRHVDFYFEFLEPEERKEVFEDLTSYEKPKIELPNFGQVGDYRVDNIGIEHVTKDDLDKKGEDFVKLFLEKNPPLHPFMEYDKKKHKYVLKPKYDLERILEEVI